MGFGEPRFVAQVPLHEAPKKSEAVEEGEFGLDKKRLDRFGWILNNHGIIGLDILRNRLEDAEEFPEDYPEYDKARYERLIGSLKNFDVKSPEFAETAEKIAGMLQSSL